MARDNGQWTISLAWAAFVIVLSAGGGLTALLQGDLWR